MVAAQLAGPRTATVSSPTFSKPAFRQTALDGPFETPGNAWISPHRPSSRARSMSSRRASVAMPRPWYSWRIAQPASLRSSPATASDQRQIVPTAVPSGSQLHGEIPQPVRGHPFEPAGVDPRDVGRGQWAAQVGHHDRARLDRFGQPAVGVDIRSEPDRGRWRCHRVHDTGRLGQPACSRGARSVRANRPSSARMAVRAASSMGRAKRYPCARSQPNARRRIAWSVVSTPSAVTVR